MVVAAPLAAVVALTEATAVLLPCAAATVARLVATRPEVEDTAVATVAAVVPLAAATTLTEQRNPATKIDKPRALWSFYWQIPYGKS